MAPTLVEQLLERIAAAVVADRATLTRIDGDSVVIEGTVDLRGSTTPAGSRWLITDPDFRRFLERREARIQAYDLSALPEPFRAQLADVRHTATVPLLHDGELLGTIAVSRRHEHPFNANDLATLTELSNIIVLVLQNSMLVDRAKKADTNLQTSEERFRLLVEGVKDYAIFMLDPTGRITSWNAGAERIKGYRAEEIIGKHFSVFYPPDDVAAGVPMRGLREAERVGRFEAEGWRLRKDGTRFWASVVITALRDETGQLRGFGKVTRDITERKRIQDQLLEAERREAARFHELADQLASLERTKSEFLKLASHELRTPISVIRGYLSLFAEGDLGVLNHRGERALAVMKSQARELTFLVGQMLEAARLQQGQVRVAAEHLDLREVAAKAVGWAQELASLDHQLVMSVPDAPVPVSADLERTSTILQSLLDNAVKFSPKGGQITCEVVADSGWARVNIADAGLGIDPEQRDLLFHPFGRVVTVDTADIGGAGLGLYLARELARLQGGDITVEPDRGRGSTFSLRLPIIPSEGLDTAPDPGATRSRPVAAIS
jgi:PAS domain S-box-containing protein